jgi:hypothetical protein
LNSVFSQTLISVTLPKIKKHENNEACPRIPQLWIPSSSLLTIWVAFVDESDAEKLTEKATLGETLRMLLYCAFRRKIRYFAQGD